MLLSPSPFGSRSAIRPRNLPSSPFRLSRGYNRAPRGAAAACTDGDARAKFVQLAGDTRWPMASRGTSSAPGYCSCWPTPRRYCHDGVELGQPRRAHHLAGHSARGGARPAPSDRRLLVRHRRADNPGVGNVGDDRPCAGDRDGSAVAGHRWRGRAWACCRAAGKRLLFRHPAAVIADSRNSGLLRGGSEERRPERMADLAALSFSPTC
jgi:hypothetical protein